MSHLKPLSPLVTLALVFTLAAGAISAATAQVKKGKTRPLTTGQLMKGIVKPHCEALKKSLETAPASDEAWEELSLRLALLNESSYTLMDDGRCPDAVWADATTKQLRQGSADALKAIEAKNYDATKAAFATVMQSCKACHEKHKPKKK